MARQKKEEVKQGLAEWMGTYGDLVTLLMCFFVLLYAMSNVDAEKFAALAASFTNMQPDILQQQSSGTGDSLLTEGSSAIFDAPMPQDGGENESGEEEADPPVPSNQPVDEGLNALASDFKTYFAQSNLTSNINQQVTPDYIRLQFTDGMLYDKGSAVLRPESIPILSEIAEQLAQYPDNDVLIEGHSDSDPINTPIYPSNMYLSAARSISVFEYFVDEKQMDPARVSAAGRGEYRPLAPNDTPENMAKNRRVEITIYSKYVHAQE